jgi:flagellar protein FlaH
MLINEMTKETKKLISTGSLEIDRKMGGGIPFGSLVLVEGGPASGKSSIVQQLLWSALEAGETVALYATEQTVHSLLKQMGSLGLDVVDHFLTDRLRIFPVTVHRGDIPDLKQFSRHLEEQFPSGVIVIDSLTTIVPSSAGDQIKDFLSECKNLCDSGQVVICTAHEDAFGEEVANRTRSVCDAYIRLHVNRSGASLLKTMEVAKIRGADMKTGNILGFEIEPNRGLRIIPVSMARA